MKIFVISLQKEQQRRDHIVEQFSKEKIDFAFYDAVMPEHLGDILKRLGLESAFTTLHQNEVGCLLSHVLLWEKAVNENLDYIAIFEDDIYLGENARFFLQDTYWIPKKCGIVKLEKFYQKMGIHLGCTQYTLAHGRSLVPLATAHMGAGGYILTQKTAHDLLNLVIKNQNLIPIDHFVFREYLQEQESKIYQMSPALCIQDVILNKGKTNFPSSLEHVRNNRKGDGFAKKKRSILMKIKRELKRVAIQFIRTIQDYLKLFQGIRIKRITFK